MCPTPKISPKWRNFAQFGHTTCLVAEYALLGFSGIVMETCQSPRRGKGNETPRVIQAEIQGKILVDICTK
jgi:hypothetical protein